MGDGDEDKEEDEYSRRRKGLRRS
jgi:hypothetical protein